ncbi:zinc ribbon domain-containing protein [Clostridium fessum]|uniref:zinc ribbon domain-containing protein n=1 Tax=Clostridium fessum TaxID=2126740 RepID=UPI0022E3FA1B|nr:zinc ribbon domain-containing protein [Clostridium fessum]
MADIKNTFSKGLTILNVKTANFLEINKIKTYITTLQTEIDTLKMELGRELYQNWAASETPVSEAMEEKLNLIREKEVQIAEQKRAEAALLEQEKQILGETAQPAAPVYNNPSMPENPVLICPNCGQVYEQPSRFCRKCGTRMN